MVRSLCTITGLFGFMLPLNSRHTRPCLKIFQNGRHRCLFIIAHQVARPHNNFDALGTLLLLDKRFQFIEWAELVKFARDEQFGALECFRKSCLCAEKRQANRHNRPDANIERGIEKSNIRAKTVTDDTNLCRVSSWLCQYAVNRPGKVEWFQAPICWLPLAFAHSAKIEAQRYHSGSGQLARQRDRQHIVHIAAGRLRVAQNNQRRIFHLCRSMDYAFQQERWLSLTLKGDQSLYRLS